MSILRVSYPLTGSCFFFRSYRQQFKQSMQMHCLEKDSTAVKMCKYLLEKPLFFFAKPIFTHPSNQQCSVSRKRASVPVTQNYFTVSLEYFILRIFNVVFVPGGIFKLLQTKLTFFWEGEKSATKIHSYREGINQEFSQYKQKCSSELSETFGIELLVAWIVTFANKPDYVGLLKLVSPKRQKKMLRQLLPTVQLFVERGRQKVLVLAA